MPGNGLVSHPGGSRNSPSYIVVMNLEKTLNSSMGHRPDTDLKF